MRRKGYKNRKGTIKKAWLGYTFTTGRDNFQYKYSQVGVAHQWPDFWGDVQKHNFLNMFIRMATRDGCTKENKGMFL